MRDLTPREREEMNALVEQLDRAIKRDSAKEQKADRREKCEPVSIERRSGNDRRTRKTA